MLRCDFLALDAPDQERCATLASWQREWFSGVGTSNQRSACGGKMTTLEPASQDVSTGAAAHPDAGETRRLRAGRLRFFRTIAESVGCRLPRREL
jgi:hypothetical protein